MRGIVLHVGPLRTMFTLSNPGSWLGPQNIFSMPFRRQVVFWDHEATGGKFLIGSFSDDQHWSPCWWFSLTKLALVPWIGTDFYLTSCDLRMAPMCYCLDLGLDDFGLWWPWPGMASSHVIISVSLYLPDLGPVPLLRCSADTELMSPVTEQTCPKFSVLPMFWDPGSAIAPPKLPTNRYCIS